MIKAAQPSSFLNELISIPGGEGIRLCIQCGTCTASCPNTNRMEHTPSHLIALVRAGMEKEALASNGMWMCLSCYMCSVRCPRDIDITRLMHLMEGLSVRYGITSRHTTTPIIYRNFNRFVTGQGRISELWLMVGYYVRTGLLKATGKLPMAVSLFIHGRISLKIPRMKPEGIRQLRAIIAGIEAEEEKQ